MVAWVTKIFLHASEPMDGVPRVLSRAAGGPYSLLAGGVRFCRDTLLSVIGITIYVGKKTSGEISEFGTHRSLWRI